jgi:hypothetical protein
MQYDPMALAALSARVLQLIGSYNDYSNRYYEQQFKGLRGTINGLSQDVKQLSEEHPRIKTSAILKASPRNVAHHWECDCARSSFVSDESHCWHRGDVSDLNDEEHWASASARSTVVPVLQSPSLSAHIQNYTPQSSPGSSLGMIKFKFGESPPYRVEGDLDPNHIEALRERFASYVEPSSKRNAAVRRSARQ